MLSLEVIFATPESQKLYCIQVEEGATIQTCIEQSDILSDYPEIDLATMKVGIFSQVKTLDFEVRDGDRIEIYRPLIADPKAVRRKRAEQLKK
ncbi:RnfH family protein [Marinicella sp. S1101]|uniref:RnfH family protein n=1 Tax=Marinicella marina TaxID=2996016 RepID=UPI0022608459|nr:RnfH family protein [Marinicella marina]MCX7554651.1 RnfH family protein [Marinicella marina]MDJ1140716.1 RnfH family protein [Marinicella marina]